MQGINDSLFARCDQSALNHFLTDSSLEGLGKDWVTRCKSNSIVISWRRRPISEWAKGLPKGDFKRVVLRHKDGFKEV